MAELVDRLSSGSGFDSTLIAGRTNAQSADLSELPRVSFRRMGERARYPAFVDCHTHTVRRISDWRT
jgi:hypothetical protein